MRPVFDLTRLEYDVLWERLELGPRRPILDIPSHGYTDDERAELRARAWQSLAVKGYAIADQIDHTLADNLALLARSEWEIDGRLHLSAADARTSVLVAANNRRAAVGVLTARGLSVGKTSPTALAAAVLVRLPEHPPGRGASVTLPADVLDACAARAGSDSAALNRALISEGLGKSEARKITDVVGSVQRFGHIGAARTPRHRDRARAGHVVSFYDTPDGRYLFTRKPSGSTTWVTLAPGSPPAITRQIDGLLGELAR